MQSQITTHLSLEAVQSVLDGVSLGATHRVEGHDLAVVEGDYGLEKEVHVTAGWVLVQMHVTELGRSPERRRSVRCSPRLIGSPKEN